MTVDTEKYLEFVDGVTSEPSRDFAQLLKRMTELEVEADCDLSHLPMFEKYLTNFIDMLELEKPTGTDTSFYNDFDANMTKLDPVGGFLAGKFGKEKADSLVNDFLFSYK